MITSRLRLVAGMQIFFAASGSTLSVAGSVIRPPGVSGAVTLVAEDAKPAANDTAWKYMGLLHHEDNVSYDPGVQEAIAYYDQSGGNARRVDLVDTWAEPVMKFKPREIDWQAIQLLFASETLSSGATTFVPVQGLPSVKGWLKGQIKDNTGVSRLTVDIYGRLSIDGEVAFGPKANTDIPYKFEVLYNVLNAGA